MTDKEIVKSVTIEKSLNEVWWAWTTHEGLFTFFGADNKIELKPGGVFEIYFLMDNPYGLRGSEGCKVLSFLPQKMLSFSWNAPPQFPDIRSDEYKTWVVVEFEQVGESETRVTLTHLGWPESKEWNKVYDYFDEAWESVLESLKGGELKRAKD
ncbi:MAG: SRPBCC domain-containing protein [Clostridia bacterium]|jgi:uncharacterized protein YndB with AHSA1/START domain|nr:SRPBCC domain-containing protein [Clostridia bacterium]MBT7122262.1 SRPBCC domain-containing protein [Clostridia bacterium]